MVRSRLFEPERHGTPLFPLILLLASACGAGSLPPPSPSVSASAVTTSAGAAGTSRATSARYRTFSLGARELPPRGFHHSPRSPEVQNAIEGLIVAELLRKGYVRADGTGDLVITFGSGRRQVEAHDAIDDDALPEDVGSTTFMKGGLVVDAVDGATGSKVWHQGDETQIDPNHVDSALLAHTVRGILASLPSPEGWAR